MTRKIQYGYLVPLERDLEMFDKFKQGRTMADIGREYNVSRERIRQIIQRCFGLTGKDNVWRENIDLFKSYIKKKDHIIERRKKRELKIYELFGCHEELVNYINGGRFSWHQNRDEIAWYYVNQSLLSSARGIVWDITLPEWWEIWKESAKYKNRGIRKGQYVMSRYGDTGPYRKDNVKICLATENIKEYYDNTPKEEISRKIKEGQNRHRSLLQATA